MQLILTTRFAEKIQKYRHTAEQHDCQFLPFVFSHNEQIHSEAVNFVCSQIDYKLGLVDGKTTPTKRNSIRKLRVRHISVATNRTASWNATRKITKMVLAPAILAPAVLTQSESQRLRRRCTLSTKPSRVERRKRLSQGQLDGGFLTEASAFYCDGE